MKIPTLSRLIISVVFHMVLALIAGAVAIAEDLPAEFGGSHTRLTVTRDFVYGMGTAISPPFYTLVIQLLFLWLTSRKEMWGTAGVVGLIAIGLMTGIGALGEPINKRIFNPATFDPIKALLMAGIILLPFVIVVFGLMEWSRRRAANGTRYGQ